MTSSNQRKQLSFELPSCAICNGTRATAGGWSKMSDEPLARGREPIERVRARLEALVMANAAPRCGARSKRTGKPCRAAAMPNGLGEVEKLIEAARKHGRYGHRDATMILLAYRHGLRASE